MSSLKQEQPHAGIGGVHESAGSNITLREVYLGNKRTRNQEDAEEYGAEQTAVSKQPSTKKKALSREIRMLSYSLKTIESFHAFAGTMAQSKDNNGILIHHNGIHRAVEPTEGIHSAEWAVESANATGPDNAFLLKMPREIIEKIFALLIDSFNDHNPLEPHKRKNIFSDPTWLSARVETSALYEVCRKLYYETVQRGLLYRFKEFRFTPQLFNNYVWVIRPRFKEVLKSIELVIRPTTISVFTPSATSALELLSELPNLKHLLLTFHRGTGDFIYVTAVTGSRARGNVQIHFAVTAGFLHAIKTSPELLSLKDLSSFNIQINIDDYSFKTVQEPQSIIALAATVDEVSKVILDVRSYRELAKRKEERTALAQEAAK